MIYSSIEVLIKPQTLGWFETPNDYKISMKLESLSFNIGNQNNYLIMMRDLFLLEGLELILDIDFEHSRSF